MYRKTKIMTKHAHSLLLGISICFLLSGSAVSAAPPISPILMSSIDGFVMRMSPRGGSITSF